VFAAIVVAGTGGRLTWKPLEPETRQLKAPRRQGAQRADDNDERATRPAVAVKIRVLLISRTSFGGVTPTQQCRRRASGLATTAPLSTR
jgi:hypothetical protein